MWEGRGEGREVAGESGGRFNDAKKTKASANEPPPPPSQALPCSPTTILRFIIHGLVVCGTVLIRGRPRYACDHHVRDGSSVGVRQSMPPETTTTSSYLLSPPVPLPFTRAACQTFHESTMVWKTVFFLGGCVVGVVGVVGMCCMHYH